MLELTELACARGQRLLFQGLSLSVEAGTVVQVAGQNGSGKTSLLRQIIGLCHLTHGSIRWHGEDTRVDRAAFHQALVFIGHLPGIKDDLTPIENLKTNAALAGESIDETRATDLLQDLGLGAQLHLPCSRLSAGQRRRVALSRLWLTKKPLWILDEPFTALDQSAVNRLTERIETHVNAGGICLYTTHQQQTIRAPHVHVLDLSEKGA